MHETTVVYAGSPYENKGAGRKTIEELVVKHEFAGNNSETVSYTNHDLAKNLASENEKLAAPLEEDARQNQELLDAEFGKTNDTIYHKFSNLLSPIPALKNAFEAYAENKEMANGTKVQSFISKLANQVSIGANLLGLLLPQNKAVEFAGKYAYRGMVGIAALSKFAKVSKYNDLIASASGVFKVMSAFNVFHLLTMPLKAVGLNVPNLNINFNNVYSFFGAANGPMNISSAANKRKMSAEGFEKPIDSVKAFLDQFKDSFSAIKQHGIGAFDPRNDTGVNGTLGGVLQIIGFATKQTGLKMRESGSPMGEALITTGNVLRDNVACFATDCERFSQANMERGRIQSVASGGNYTTEGILDVLLNLPFMKPFERQIESLMGLFGTWAAASNTAAVKEENAEFVGEDQLKADNMPDFLMSVGKAMLKANAGHCLPDNIANNIVNFKRQKSAPAPEEATSEAKAPVTAQ